ncbi:unnamed protein product [Tilletia controversa]|uniref:Uncharacterized protein n=3 Tax=Tilletia TaxID=13289 RepID=A0A8X7SU60_9BASI|nr:hypothetical protein CF335_g5981 [Tilletia laevis]KAE8242392.1 hypothetical protein A4X06_0g6945 [Tilletia controversa]KAE8252982.1 hypothetical protein A4X03_0g6022 [Tilletia caries]CAD6887664.1 unnamed protein product [Tilletia caries]CAD6905314.1 unnamed protein product [Tilletia laevis]
MSTVIVRPTPSILKRGEVRDIVHTIRDKKTTGSNFCSTFLHLPPYATTTTRTITKTASATLASSTLVKTASITKTASPVTKFSTQLSVVQVTPTVVQTIATVLPFTSTVTTVTSVVTATTAVTQTFTTFTAVAERRGKNVNIPRWLQPHCSASISRACSHIVVPKTKTCTKTVTTTKTVKGGVNTVTGSKVATIIVTPTKTSVVTSTSTNTKPAITKTTVITSSSLVPVTATVLDTTVLTVTSTAVIALPTPTIAGRIKIMNADGTFFGYFGPVSGDYGATSVTDSADNALVVSIRPSISGLINIINPSGSSFPYLGTVMGTDRQNSANDIGPGLFNYIIIGNVNKVDAGTQSTDMTQNSLTSSGAPPAVYESRVWSYDPDTGSLQLTWTNSDGSSVSNPTLIAFQAQGATFFEFTGDEAAYRTRYDGFLTQNLNLIFVPNV